VSLQLVNIKFTSLRSASWQSDANMLPSYTYNHTIFMPFSKIR